MNLLDENFPDDQLPVLKKLGVACRQIGRDVAWLGIKDDAIIPLLHRSRNVTFFTNDRGFFQRHLCHAAYCLVWLDVRADDFAHCVRRFLRHPRFVTNALRMGIVARVHPDGIHFWERNRGALQHATWPKG